MLEVSARTGAEASTPFGRATDAVEAVLFATLTNETPEAVIGEYLFSMRAVSDVLTLSGPWLAEADAAAAASLSVKTPTLDDETFAVDAAARSADGGFEEDGDESLPFDTPQVFALLPGETAEIRLSATAAVATQAGEPPAVPLPAAAPLLAAGLGALALAGRRRR